MVYWVIFLNHQNKFPSFASRLDFSKNFSENVNSQQNEIAVYEKYKSEQNPLTCWR
jgi:hypothetical protein